MRTNSAAFILLFAATFLLASYSIAQDVAADPEIDLSSIDMEQLQAQLEARSKKSPKEKARREKAISYGYDEDELDLYDEENNVERVDDGDDEDDDGGDDDDDDNKSGLPKNVKFQAAGETLNEKMAEGGEEMNELYTQTLEQVRKMIEEVDVMLYARGNTGPYRSARKLLRDMNVDYFDLDLKKIAGEKILVEVLLNTFQVNKYPAIFVKQKFVGSAAELEVMSTKERKALFKDCQQKSYWHEGDEVNNDEIVEL